MSEISVAILAADEENRTVLQMMVDSTTIARTTYTSGSLPVGSTDATLRRIRDCRPEVLIIDLPTENPEPGFRAIELLQHAVQSMAIFAVGDVNQPQVIIAAMRCGAREFMECPVNSTQLLDAFVRVTAARRQTRVSDARGKVFTAVNAKGGCGATTIAVNLAVSLQESLGGVGVALVDLAPLGHVALYLSLKPSFTIADAIRNLHRLDASLLDSYVTRHPSGVHVLAGVTDPLSAEAPSSDLAKLFDMLVERYTYVIVDSSTRCDATVRTASELSDTVLLIAQPDVACLWSAARMHRYLSASGSGERLKLVLNRFRKIPGFSDSEAEQVTGAKVLWKVPNHYSLVANSLDHGFPLALQNHSEIARSIVDLAATLTEGQIGRARGMWSLFKSA